MNPYEAPIQAELVPPPKPPTNPLEIVWQITVMIVICACLWVALTFWIDLL